MNARPFATALAPASLLTAATSAEAQWMRRRPVEITSTLAAPGADLPMPVRPTPATFTHDNASTDGSDVGFATADDAHVSGVFDLSHFIGTWDTGGDTLRWVRPPVIPGPGSTTVCLDSGNPAAADTSDLATTFPSVYQSTDSEALSGTLAADWFEIPAGHSVDVVPARRSTSRRGG